MIFSIGFLLVVAGLLIEWVVQHQVRSDDLANQIYKVTVTLAAAGVFMMAVYAAILVARYLP